LGKLGEAQPILAAFTITNGPETLTYLSSAPLTCADMMMMGAKWLSKLPAGTQVIEIVVPGTASAKTYQIGGLQGEVHYAEGGKSSSSEASASSGSIVFTQAAKGSAHDGTFTAQFSGSPVTGSFHAEWCQGGSEY
jgi:hypothetical protein